MLTLGVGPGPSLDGLAPPYSLDEPAARDEATLAEALAEKRQEDVLVVVAPAWADPGHVHALATTRRALGATVAVWRTELPPLAAATLAALAAAIAPSVPARGEMLAALGALEEELVVLAWLPSVARLEHPPPSLRQRLRSRLPRASFLAHVQPEAAVERLDREALVPLAAPPDLYASAVAGPDDAVARLDPALAADADLIAPVPAAARWWGTPRAVEIVAWPRDLEAVAARSRPTSRPGCPWCGEIAVWRPCPVCGHDRNPALAEPLGVGA